MNRFTSFILGLISVVSLSCAPLGTSIRESVAPPPVQGDIGIIISVQTSEEASIIKDNIDSIVNGVNIACKERPDIVFINLGISDLFSFEHNGDYQIAALCRQNRLQYILLLKVVPRSIGLSKNYPEYACRTETRLHSCDGVLFRRYKFDTFLGKSYMNTPSLSGVIMDSVKGAVKATFEAGKASNP